MILSYILWILLLVVGEIENRKSLYRSVYAKYEGNIYIAGMFSMRRDLNKTVLDSTCDGSLIDQDGLQVLAAAAYGLEEIKNRGIIPNLTIGIVAIDTCQNANYALEQSKDFLRFRSADVSDTYYCPNSNNQPPEPKKEFLSFNNIFGVYGAANSDVSIVAATFLRLMDLPQISFFSTTPILSNARKFPLFFRTIPSDVYSLKNIIYILKYYKWNNVLVIADSSEYSKTLLKGFDATIEELSNNSTYDVCRMKDVVSISLTNSNEDWKNTFNTIYQKVGGQFKVSVILTFLSQSVAESMLAYVDNNPDPRISKLLWMGTDAWVGRDWSFITATNSILQNTIGVIPSSDEVEGFWNYYTNRLPSKIDSDPWLALRFEQICKCQYHNSSLFIYSELAKMRRQLLGSRECEKLEKTCRPEVYKNSKPMLYIHYVIDGILAYAYAIKPLIPKICQADNVTKECNNQLWKNLTALKIAEQLRIISFNDSTGHPFHFFNQRDGIPRYSIVYYNQSISSWSIVGSISNLANDTKLTVTDEFNQIASIKLRIEPCSKPCKLEEAKSYSQTMDLSNPLKTINYCCWTCIKCDSKSIVVNMTVGDQQKCQSCPIGSHPDNYYIKCVNFKVTSLNFSHPAAVVIIVFNMIGLLGCVLSTVVFILYWNTPIIKASARETGTILLLSITASFACSIGLLDLPTNISCYMRWTTPALCSTLAYAAILTRTNRIARIFSVKSTSKKGLNTPKFVGSISQVNIVLIIMLMETIIVTAVSITNNPHVEVRNTMKERLLDCTPSIDTSTILAEFCIPLTLLLSSTIYAFKIRKAPQGYNEARNLNFLNFANCVVSLTCLLLHQILQNDITSVLPLALMLTLGGYGSLLGLFAYKGYLVLFRPHKNTQQAVWSRSNSRSELKLGSSQSLENLRCRNCNMTISNDNNGVKERTETILKENQSYNNNLNRTVYVPQEDIQKIPDSVAPHGQTNKLFEEDFN